MLLSSELKLPGPADPDEGAMEPPRGPMEALFPDPERASRLVFEAGPGQLPSTENSSWLERERPSPAARCWIDVAENPELYPDAIGRHLAEREACLDHLSRFGVGLGIYGVRH